MFVGCGYTKSPWRSRPGSSFEQDAIRTASRDAYGPARPGGALRQLKHSGGLGRGTVPEFRQFLQYCSGSAQETLTQLRVAAALDPVHAHAIHEIEGESRSSSRRSGA